MEEQTIAPGARVRIRDAEWLVKRTDRTSDGDQVLDVVGLSELVEDQEARFIRELEEDTFELIDPAEKAATGHLTRLLFRRGSEESNVLFPKALHGGLTGPVSRSGKKAVLVHLRLRRALQKVASALGFDGQKAFPVVDLADEVGMMGDFADSSGMRW